MPEPEKPPQGGPPKSPDKAQPNPWTPEMVKTILDGVTPLVDRYIALKEKEFAFEVNLERATSKASWWVLFILMAFLGAVILLMSYLVAIGRVSGDALLFIVGTVAGYIMAIVQRHLFPQTVEVPEQ